MDTPDTAAADAWADTASPSGSSGLRRRLLGAGLIGLAGALVPNLAGRTGASPDQTTTTAPPRRPDDADTVQLEFAQTLELTAKGLYDLALASAELGDTTRAIITEVAAAHLAYAQALGALLGRSFPGEPLQALVDEGTEAFTGSQADVVAAAADLENVIVATLAEMIGVLSGINGAALVSSMLIAESRHALVFSDLAGRTELDELLLNDATALVPEEG